MFFFFLSNKKRENTKKKHRSNQQTAQHKSHLYVALFQGHSLLLFLYNARSFVLCYYKLLNKTIFLIAQFVPNWIFIVVSIIKKEQS